VRIFEKLHKWMHVVRVGTWLLGLQLGRHMNMNLYACVCSCCYETDSQNKLWEPRLHGYVDTSNQR